MNSSVAIIWLAARTGSSGSAVKSASTSLLAAAAVTWEAVTHAEGEGLREGQVLRHRRSRGKRGEVGVVEDQVVRMGRLQAVAEVAGAAAVKSEDVSTQVPRWDGAGGVQEGGAAGQLGADLVGQAGAGEPGHVDGDVGLGEQLIVSPPVRWSGSAAG
jgi:hypothetical protein